MKGSDYRLLTSGMTEKGGSITIVLRLKIICSPRKMGMEITDDLALVTFDDLENNIVGLFFPNHS